MPINFFGRPFPHCNSQMRDHQLALRLYLEDMYSLLPPELQQLISRYLRCPVSSPTVSSNEFRASLEVKDFKPEEISVRVVDTTIVVEGKFEEREDEHGRIAKQFVRKYNVGKEFDLGRVESRLSSDGILNVTAPRIAGGEEAGVTVIPVIQTGESSN